MSNNIRKTSFLIQFYKNLENVDRLLLVKCISAFIFTDRTYFFQKKKHLKT